MNTRIIIVIAACAAIVFFLYSLTPDSNEIRNSSPQGKAIVCFGDSLTFGTGARSGMDYPSQLSLMIGLPVINEGVPGDTTAMALNRLDDLLEHQPSIVLLTLGGNDLKNGISREEAFRNLELIINRIQDVGALVVLGGLEIRFHGRGFGKAYEELGKEAGAVLVPDVLLDIIENRNLMSDVIHPNREGYTIMAQHFFKALQPYL